MHYIQIHVFKATLIVDFQFSCKQGQNANRGITSFIKLFLFKPGSNIHYKALNAYLRNHM